MSVVYKALVYWVLLFVVKYISIYLRSTLSVYIQRKNESLPSSLSQSSLLLLSIRDCILNALDSIWSSISINPFVVNIEIKRSVMNYLYKYMIFKEKRYINLFMNIGVCLMTIGVLITPCYLVSALINNIITTPRSLYSHEHDMSSVSSAIITPIIPGINFPLRFAFIFWICYTIVTVIHELGHALAALNEGLDMEGFGIFFAFLFPGAYVTIEDTVKYLPMIAQLRIYSGGIYANVLFTIMCYLIMSLSSIGLQMGGYKRPGGIAVAQLPSKSVLNGYLQLGNTIKEVGNTPIHNSIDWLIGIDNVESSTTTFSYTWISTSTIDRQYIQKGGSHANILSVTDATTKQTIINTTTRSINSIELKHKDENNTFSNIESEINNNNNNNMDTTSNTDITSSTTDANNDYVTIYNHNDDDNNNIERRLSSSNRARIYTRAAGGGYCYDNAAVSEFEQNDLSCCDNVFVLSIVASADNNYCFMEPHRAFNSSVVYGPYDNTMSWICAPALLMYDKQLPSCANDNDCDDDTKCLRPVTKTMSDRLVRIKYTEKSEQEEFLLYEGSLLLLSSTNTIGVANYDSTWMKSLLKIKGLGFITNFFQSIYSFYIFLPDLIYLSLWLCSQLSFSLAVLNTLPIVSLDGGHAFPQIVRYLYPTNQWYDISMAFIYPCTGILILNIMLSMYKHNWF